MYSGVMKGLRFVFSPGFRVGDWTLLLSDLLHPFPEIQVRQGEPRRLTIHRIDALHSSAAPVDGTLYLHADPAEAQRIVGAGTSSITWVGWAF